MTMPDERTRALLRARQLLLKLSRANPAGNLERFRQEAVAVLRHYPDDGEVALIATQSSWLEWPC
ncbi:hypothetical protein OKW42_006705 [Paraburkholderia sp. WC7.3d]